jgi:hypothetical protein
MRHSLAVAPQYWPAIKWAATQQAVTGVVSAMLLDGGVLFRVWCIAFLAFWAAVLLIVLRRPISPTRVDILLIKCGFIPMFIVAFCVSPGVWSYLGILQ